MILTVSSRIRCFQCASSTPSSCGTYLRVLVPYCKPSSPGLSSHLMIMELRISCTPAM